MYVAPTPPTIASLPKSPSLAAAAASAGGVPSPSSTLPAVLTTTTSSGRDISGDFAVSPFLLLPDSFGDIYMGEVFSAYIAAVNGVQDSALFQVTLSIRLQTTNNVYELGDVRPSPGAISGQAKVLAPNESTDVVVRHKLNELGSHTLRATVSYMVNRSNEVKTLRKFYRFNVLQPLNVVSTCSELGNKIMVQCVISNLAKSPIYLEEVSRSKRSFKITTANGENIVIDFYPCTCTLW
jgi:trafficking protein particle complex subunit 13